MKESERPQFMGVLTKPDGKKNYFFMYDEGNFHGIFNSGYASTFAGEITPERVNFELYPEPGGLTSDSIKYEGIKVNGRYEGSYTFKRRFGVVTKGNFILEAYTPSETLDTIVETSFHSRLVRTGIIK